MRRAQQQQALAKASAASPDGRNMNSSKHRTCCPSVRAHWRPFLYSIPEVRSSRLIAVMVLIMFFAFFSFMHECFEAKSCKHTPISSHTSTKEVRYPLQVASINADRLCKILSIRHIMQCPDSIHCCKAQSKSYALFLQPFHCVTSILSVPALQKEIESRVQQSCEANCSTSDRTHTENHQTEDNPHHVNLDMKNPRALRKPRMAQVGFQVHCRKTALKLLEKCNMEEVQVDSRLCKPEAASDHSFRKVQYKAWKNMFCIFSGMKQ